MGKIIVDPNMGKWVTLDEIAPKDIRYEVSRSERHFFLEILTLENAWKFTSENLKFWRLQNEAGKIKERFQRIRLSIHSPGNILIELHIAGEPRLIKYGVDDLVVKLTNYTKASFSRRIGKGWYHITIAAKYTPEQTRT